MKCDVILALDVPTRDDARAVLDRMGPDLRWVKIGLQLFTRHGPELVEEVADRGYSVFLDLKLHDIPNTVAKAVASLGSLPVRLLTVHASGGSEMLRRAEEARQTHAPELKLLAVTVLTSLDRAGLKEVGIEAAPPDQVRRLARLAAACGVGGLVCSPLETADLRDELGAGVTLVTPGIRLPGDSADEQKRITTPAEAARAGADFIVMGRPLLRAEKPAEVLAAVREQLAS